jgi:hypothetical protein
MYFVINLEKGIGRLKRQFEKWRKGKMGEVQVRKEEVR